LITDFGKIRVLMFGDFYEKLSTPLSINKFFSNLQLQPAAGYKLQMMELSTLFGMSTILETWCSSGAPEILYWMGPKN